MKDKTIKVIEESYRDEERMSTDYKFSILFHPLAGSLDVKIYEKRFEITDAQITQANDPRMVQFIRRENAIKVFDEYYTDNFLLPTTTLSDKNK